MAQASRGVADLLLWAEARMGCGSGVGFGVTSVMVGLERIGLVGLKAALEEADASGLTDREQLTDRLVTALAADNYIRDEDREGFRVAIWREYLRHKGEDLTDYLSVVEVTVQGEPGEERARFVEMLRSILAGFELRAEVSYAPRAGHGRYPRLEIAGDTIMEGLPPTRRSFEAALSRTFSDW